MLKKDEDSGIEGLQKQLDELDEKHKAQILEKTEKMKAQYAEKLGSVLTLKLEKNEKRIKEYNDQINELEPELVKLSKTMSKLQNEAESYKEKAYQLELLHPKLLSKSSKKKPQKEAAPAQKKSDQDDTKFFKDMEKHIKMKDLSPVVKSIVKNAAITRFPEFSADYDHSKKRTFMQWTKMIDKHGNRFVYQGEVDESERPDGRGIDIQDLKDGKQEINIGFHQNGLSHGNQVNIKTDGTRRYFLCKKGDVEKSSVIRVNAYGEHQDESKTDAACTHTLCAGMGLCKSLRD